MSRTLLALGIATLCGSGLAEGSPDEVIQVSSSQELVAALQQQGSGRHIRLLAGDYPVTVHWRCRMEPPSKVLASCARRADCRLNSNRALRRRSVSLASFEGDLLTLGNGVTISGLRLEDLKTAPDSSPQRAGNVVVVSSRAPNDSLSAEIRNCEIINPNNSAALMDGPGGHGLAVLTRNPARGDLPPPHEGAKIAVRMEKSIVRTDGSGSALFAMNFAAHGNCQWNWQAIISKGDWTLPVASAGQTW